MLGSARRNRAISTIEGPLHFIGIAGSGMAPLACYMKEQGFSVQGSDLSDGKTNYFKSKDIPVFQTHDPKNLEGAKTVVVSSAITKQNPEYAEARKREIPILHRSELLNHAAKGKHFVTVTGTHGKSTCAALISFLLEKLGAKPSIILGAESDFLKEGSYQVGNGKLFVAEADESDGSFLRYQPFIGVLTNCDLDHLDHYGSLDNLKNNFQEYLTNIDSEGCAVVGWDNAICREISREIETARLGYGELIGSDVRAVNIEHAGESTHFLAVVERDQFRVVQPLIGTHNVTNVLCALAVVRALDLDVKQAIAHLKDFPGVKRRLEKKHHTATLTIFDDYAHNPGKIAATLHALRTSFPTKEITVVFQPHRHSRIKTTYDESCEAFQNADFLVLLPVYEAFEQTDEKISVDSLALDIARASDVNVKAADSFDKAAELALNVSGKSGIIVTMGAGDVHQVANKITGLLFAKPPEKTPKNHQRLS